MAVTRSSPAINVCSCVGTWRRNDCDADSSTSQWTRRRFQFRFRSHSRARDDGSYHREATWAGPMSGEATGGGASRFFEMPEWQRALGLDARSSMRLSPDVAGPGDPDSGLLVMSTPVELDGEAWVPASACGDGSTPPCRSFGGGTSQSAPFWAGLATLIRQGAEERGLLPVIDGRPRLPHLLLLLYRVAASRPDAFNDVSLGSNLLEDAVPGWDPATGLGTPNAPVLAEAIWDELRTRADGASG